MKSLKLKTTGVSSLSLHFGKSARSSSRSPVSGSMRQLLISWRCESGQCRASPRDRLDTIRESKSKQHSDHWDHSGQQEPLNSQLEGVALFLYPYFVRVAYFTRFRMTGITNKPPLLCIQDSNFEISDSRNNKLYGLYIWSLFQNLQNKNDRRISDFRCMLFCDRS